MHSLSTVVESAITVLALAGATHGLAVPTAEPYHSSHEEVNGEPIEVTIFEIGLNVTGYHNVTTPTNTTATTTTANLVTRSVVYDLLPMTEEEEAKYAAYRYSRPSLRMPTHPPHNSINNTNNTNTTALQPRGKDKGDKDGINYCAYQRTDSGFHRIWELVAPHVPNDQIPSLCGGLWDNLQRFPVCLPSMTYCGPQRFEHEGEAGLELIFKSQSLCDSGMVGSAWWEATGKEEGLYGNMWCEQAPWSKNFWQDGVNTIIKWIGMDEAEKAEFFKELIEGEGEEDEADEEEEVREVQEVSEVQEMPKEKE